MGEAVEHIGEYYNEARSAIYPQFIYPLSIVFALFGHIKRAALYMPE